IKAIGCTPKSARTAIGSRAGYSSGDDSYSTTEFHIANDESHPFAGDDGPPGQAEDISSDPDFTPERVVEPDDGVSPLFAADEWRRNHDCFSKYWLSPHRIFHEVI